MAADGTVIEGMVPAARERGTGNWTRAVGHVKEELCVGTRELRVSSRGRRTNLSPRKPKREWNSGSDADVLRARALGNPVNFAATFSTRAPIHALFTLSACVQQYKAYGPNAAQFAQASS
jgi:hypothetical protein